MSLAFPMGGISDYKNGPKQQNFSPYSDNGGSIVAVAGEDFAVIASDTRLTNGYSIFTREQSKLFKLSDKTTLGCSGCWCDAQTLTTMLQIRMQMYQYDNNKTMSTPAIAQLLSTMLYYKRFFPYYVSNILAGVDNEGKGIVYSYDPIGHCESNMYRAGGSSGPLLQPLLDNQLGLDNQEGVVPQPLSMEKAVAIVKDVFTAAAERDVHTGDGIIIHVITKDGTKEESFPLRRD